MRETQESIGKLLTSSHRRDAIHVAVLPIYTRSVVKPGEAIDSRGYATARGQGIGVVDPFLTEPVESNRYVYVFMYPDTISGLRHTWMHPAVDDDAEPEVDPETEAEWSCGRNC